jgi:hypothetical protein
MPRDDKITGQCFQEYSCNRSPNATDVGIAILDILLLSSV